jgi:ketosteroid isomerase-like protein
VPGASDVVRSAIEAFNAEGIEGALRYTDPAVEMHAFPEWPGPPTYRGHDGFRDLVAEWTENFDGYQWEVLEIREGGDRVAALARHRGRTRDAGITVEQTIGSVWEVRGGRIVRAEYFLSWEEALDRFQDPL